MCMTHYLKNLNHVQLKQLEIQFSVINRQFLVMYINVLMYIKSQILHDWFKVTAILLGVRKLLLGVRNVLLGVRKAVTMFHKGIAMC